MIKFAIDFLLGAMVLTAVWAAVGLSLVRLLRIDSPGARTLIFVVPLLAAFATRVRLASGWWIDIAALSVGIALLHMTRELRRYTVFLNKVETETVADAGLQRLVDSLATNFGMKAPRVLVSSDPGLSPFVAGLRKPLLVVPEALLSVLDRDELRVLLAHELAHIRRKDLVWKWVLLFIRYLAFLNPIAYWPYRWLGLEMERACDRLAASVTRKPGTLARTLLKVEEYLSKDSLVTHTAMPAMMATMSSCLPQRIDLLATGGVEGRAGLTALKVLAVFFVYFLICLRPGQIWLGAWLP